MIPKSVQRFSERIMLHQQQLERDDDSKNRHPALVVDKLQAGYGPAQVLFDVSFSIDAGEVVTLLGRNGMGKTTTIKTVMGLLAARGGSVRFANEELLGRPSYRIAQRGLGLVPEGRQIFPT